MGVSESKIIIHSLQMACFDAERKGEDGVAVVLSQPEFMKALRKLWTSIPVKTRRSIGRCPPKPNPQGSQRGSKEPITSKITVPSTIKFGLRIWEKDPVSFFAEGESKIDPSSYFYTYMRKLGRRKEKDTIRSRFIKVLYHRLKDRLGLSQIRSGNAEAVARLIFETGTGGNDLNTIKQNVSKWATEGRRIDALCQDVSRTDSLDYLHLGVLFCLPEDVSDEFIRALPLQGEHRENEISQLRNRGILTVDDKKRLHDLANVIFGCLWENVESSISRNIPLTESNQNWAVQQTRAFRIQPGAEPRTEEHETASLSYSAPSNPSEYSSLAVSPGVSFHGRSSELQTNAQYQNHEATQASGFDGTEGHAGSEPASAQVNISDASIFLSDNPDASEGHLQQIQMQPPQESHSAQFDASFSEDRSNSMFNPRQYGQATIPLGGPTCQNSVGMLFDNPQIPSDTFIPHNTFNPRQHGQPMISLGDFPTPDTVGVQFGNSQILAGRFAPQDIFDPRQYGQPVVSFGTPTTRDNLAMQFGSTQNSAKTPQSYDIFNPMQYGQPIISSNIPMGPITTRGQVLNNQMSADTLESQDLFNPRKHGQRTVSSYESGVQNIFDSQQIGNVGFQQMEVQS